MNLLAPLGLLGLIGIIILIIIYIIKPNYQSKFISSTFIWKLSLKYKRKKIPLSKLRNIILFICQVLILASAAFILAQPVLDDAIAKEGGDRILIIDASASMQANFNGKTRFGRATDLAFDDATEALEKGDRITLIVAADEATFLVREAGKDSAENVYEAFDMLREKPEELMTYGTPNIKGAMSLAEQITMYAQNASVSLYTDTTYIKTGAVEVVDAKDPAEWNAAILDVRATVVENYYRIEVDVACYGADARIAVNCDIADYNNTGLTLANEVDAYCMNDEVTTLVFAFVSEDMLPAEQERINQAISVYSYEHIYVHITENDSLDADNRYYLYGGHKPVLKVQYYSRLPNNYFTTALLVLQDSFKEDWEIQIDEVIENPATEGYDIYIYEHDAPAEVPSDGLVIYVNASNMPADAGIRFSNFVQSGEELFLQPGENHSILKNITPGNISVTQFMAVAASDGYTSLMTYEGYPLMLLREEESSKILVLPFSMHYSNLALTLDFPILLYNMLGHYFPTTLEEYVYEVNDPIKVNARSNLLEIEGPGTQKDFSEFPAEWVAHMPGTYTLMQNPFSGDFVIESIYVKIPAEESNINLTEDVLDTPYFYTEADSEAMDLLFYLALAAVLLLFFEWWLKSREQI